MRTLLAAVILAGVAACATSGGRRAVPGDRDIITRSAIVQSGGINAYEVVERTRPEMLREQRGGSRTVNNPIPLLAIVYMNGVRQGGPDILRTFAVSDVEEIHFIDGKDATTRYGTGHGGGVIEIISRRP